MKKLLSLLLTITFVLGLGACESSSPDIDDLQAQIDNLDVYNEAVFYGEISQLEVAIQELEAEIIAIQLQLDNLTVTQGLNGYISIYENEVSQLATMNNTLTQLKDTLDKTKVPDYVLDENGDYISFNDLMATLKLKYFGIESSYNDSYEIDNNVNIVIYDKTSGLTIDEVIARTAMLMNELKDYEYYLIWSSMLDFHYYLFIDSVDYQIRFYIPMGMMINDYFVIEPASLINQQYEMRLVKSSNVTYNELNSQTYYDDYILNDTFIGYVLNYTK